MKAPGIIGILLIILGVAGLAFADKKESLPVPPILGALAIVGGIVLVASSARRA